MSEFTLTCNSCGVAYKQSEEHKIHYQSDWHRYNLKRKVAGLPSVTDEEYNSRVLAQRAIIESKNVGNQPVHCEYCKKRFVNQKSYDNHLNSKKHVANVKSYNEKPPSPQNKESTLPESDAKMEIDEECFETNSEIEEIDSDEWDGDNPIDNNDCLFCGHHSRSLVRNLKHMSSKHTFFIPDVEYCINIAGLLRYLGEKISVCFMCIWCNEKGKSFKSADAAQMHMLDKGHCKMLHEGLALAEYTEFYDYSASYPDADKEDVNINDEVDEIPELEGTDYQLVLPSGAVIGHRSLMRYYKQNKDPNREIVVQKNTKKLHKVLAEYKSLGWKTTQLEAAARNARDIHYMKRLQSKLQMKLGVKANKFQKHYRCQVNF